MRAYQLNAAEVPGLIWRIALGRIPMKAYYGDDLIHNTGSVPVEFLLIFDQRTDHLAAPDGILVLGTPIRGSIGQISAASRQFTEEVGGGNYEKDLQNIITPSIQLSPDNVLPMKFRTIPVLVTLLVARTVEAQPELIC